MPPPTRKPPDCDGASGQRLSRVADACPGQLGLHDIARLLVELGPANGVELQRALGCVCSDDDGCGLLRGIQRRVGGARHHVEQREESQHSERKAAERQIAPANLVRQPAEQDIERCADAKRDGDDDVRLKPVDLENVLQEEQAVERARVPDHRLPGDETEQGDRALLNLGHTFCHALEAATGYSSRLLHGEGVAIGCALAFETSARLGLCAQEEPSRVRAHLAAMGMKVALKDIPGDLPDADALLALMAQDKKVLDGKLRFIMARGIGAAFVTSDVPQDVVGGLLSEELARR